MRNVLLMVIASALAILVAEAAVRLALPAPGYVPREEPAGLLVPHPVRDYAYAAGFSHEVTTDEYSIHIDINSMGLRDDPIAQNGPVDVLAVGDSFTVGFGVNAAEAWPSQLETRLNGGSGSSSPINVVNAGISGYSIRQIRLFLEELTVLEPRLVVLGLYTSRYWRISNPYVYFGGDAILRDSVPQLKIMDDGFIRSPLHSQTLRKLYFWLAQYLHIGAYSLEAAQTIKTWLSDEAGRANERKAEKSLEEDLAPLLVELGLINEVVRERGASLLVLLVNEQQPDGHFDEIEAQYNEIVREYCSIHRIDVLDPLPVLESSSSGVPRFRIGKDHHWSKEAHALVAQQLAEILTNEKAHIR